MSLFWLFCTMMLRGITGNGRTENWGRREAKFVFQWQTISATQNWELYRIASFVLHTSSVPTECITSLHHEYRGIEHLVSRLFPRPLVAWCRKGKSWGGAGNEATLSRSAYPVGSWFLVNIAPGTVTPLCIRQLKATVTYRSEVRYSLILRSLSRFLSFSVQKGKQRSQNEAKTYRHVVSFCTTQKQDTVKDDYRNISPIWIYNNALSRCVHVYVNRLLMWKTSKWNQLTLIVISTY